MTEPPAPGRGRVALLALYLILLTTVGWWALALWPAPGAPEWLSRTRALCFGSAPDGLPDAGGWILLIGQPLGMIGVLLAVWGDEVLGAVGRLRTRLGGQLLLVATGLLLLTGASLAVGRIQRAGAEPFDPQAGGQALTRLNDPAPALSLVDQRGDTVTLDRYRGRPVLVTFAYAHCQTVCPLVVHEAIEAQQATTDLNAALVIVTLDPWRDTPARLPAIAAGWALGADASVVSGEVDAVERVLSNWRIPRVRNESTGDLSHPAVVYVISPEGRIAYALPGGTAALTEAVRAL